MMDVCSAWCEVFKKKRECFLMGQAHVAFSFTWQKQRPVICLNRLYTFSFRENSRQCWLVTVELWLELEDVAANLIWSCQQQSQAEEYVPYISPGVFNLALFLGPLASNGRVKIKCVKLERIPQSGLVMGPVAEKGPHAATTKEPQRWCNENCHIHMRSVSDTKGEHPNLFTPTHYTHNYTACCYTVTQLQIAWCVVFYISDCSQSATQYLAFVHCVICCRSTCFLAIGQHILHPDRFYSSIIESLIYYNKSNEHLWFVCCINAVYL